MLATKKRINVGEVVVSPQARANVIDALRNNRLSRGRYTMEFERRMALLHGKRFATFVNSGTDALRIGLAAMKEHFGWLPNSNVVVPALTFVATPNVVWQNGLNVRFVDIELDSYGIDPARLEVNYGDVAIMPAHLFGKPVRPEVILWAKEHHYRILDDSCETVGMAGCSDGDISAFSTYACHLLQSGVGGVATTNDPLLAKLVFSLANHGRSGVYFAIDQELGNHQVIDSRFKFEREGYSSRLTEMEAGIALDELDGWDRNLSIRNINAKILTDGLEGLPLTLPSGPSAWMMYVVRAEDRATRDRLVQHLEANNIETRYAVPLINQPYLVKRYGDLSREFPNAHLMNETSFYVGCHHHLSNEDLARIIEAFRSFFEKDA